MHDLRYLRDNLDAVRAGLGTRGGDVPWEELGKVLQERRSLTAQVDELRHQLKTGSSDVARLKREKQPADQATASMALGDRISNMDSQVRTLEERVTELALGIPNLPHESVPAGTSSADNREVRRWGQAPAMSFTPKPHWEIGEALGILDFERATKIAGARFVVMMGLGARLERALINYMLDVHTARHGYQEVLPPFMVNRAAMTGTGQLPKFESDLFSLRDDDFFLSLLPRCRSPTFFAKKFFQTIVSLFATRRTHPVTAARPVPMGKIPVTNPAPSIQQGRAGRLFTAGESYAHLRAHGSSRSSVPRLLVLPCRRDVTISGRKWDFPPREP